MSIDSLSVRTLIIYLFLYAISSDFNTGYIPALTNIVENVSEGRICFQHIINRD